MNPHPSLVPRPPGEEPKPVRELLEDIHRRSEAFHGSRGIFNQRLVDQIAFGVTLVSVVMCATTLLMIVWQSVDPRHGLRVIGSVLIVLFAILIFRSVNRIFAE